MVKHKIKQENKSFIKIIHDLEHILNRYHHVQVFDVHSNVDSDEQFSEIFSNEIVRIIYNHEYDYIEILTDNLCLKGEILHLFTEPDPDELDCCRIK